VPVLLARIDDRLMHGQVAYGWSRALEPTLYAIVSDSLRSDPDRADLYLLAVPEGARGCVVSVDEALGQEFGAEAARERTLLLLPGTDEAARLVAGGFPLAELNLGGLHFAPGKREALPYVYWDDEDRARLASIARRGVRVVAQDLPSNAAHPLESLLRAEA
jgi:mannose/fructose/N-acetylgalactosamine-specific phosphotransferase system component IIB